MTRIYNITVAAKIFENIIFLAEVFGDRADRDIPKIPVLEMAQCFDLSRSQAQSRHRKRREDWPLWQ